MAQPQTLRNKINFVLKLVETQRIIPSKFFRIIEGSDGIYEIRVEIESNIYRIFCCLDGGAVVVLFQISPSAEYYPRNNLIDVKWVAKKV